MLRTLGARLVPKRTIVVFNKGYASDKSGKNSSSETNHQCIPNVPGLSGAVVDVPDYPVGFRGAKKDAEYKNPEYFCYHVDSFADAFIEMEKYRLPAPSNKAGKK
ncbi:uncharacterized protein LOC106643319 [Copidosoma floridanum]|uniref:uncharacterized protein LOC106643319 n=1 Tax=Copidosoma floridanum TaxID=29053 RepID=UPI0006C9AC66|nr:uncharacterized protein LOC106643319 [Copidosoma floridanum]